MKLKKKTKSHSIDLSKLKWKSAKIIAPIATIYLKGDEIIGVKFEGEPIKWRKNFATKKRKKSAN